MERTKVELSPEQYGLLETKRCENGRLVGIMPFLFTWAIVADLTDVGYEDRWCYKSLQDARSALKEWNGDGEPEGWHRHPLSGRRIDESGREYVQA